MTDETMDWTVMPARLEAIIQRVTPYRNDVMRHRNRIPLAFGYSAWIGEHEKFSFSGTSPESGPAKNLIMLNVTNSQASNSHPKLEDLRKGMTIDHVHAECVEKQNPDAAKIYEFGPTDNPKLTSDIKKRLDYSLPELVYWMNVKSPFVQLVAGDPNEFSYRTRYTSEAGAMCEAIRAASIPLKATQKAAPGK